MRRPSPTRHPSVLSALSAATAAVLMVLAACSGGDAPAGDQATDSLTRRQRDSLLSTMPVPGAGAVGRALRASDSLRSRALSHDTLR